VGVGKWETTGERSTANGAVEVPHKPPQKGFKVRNGWLPKRKRREKDADCGRDGGCDLGISRVKRVNKGIPIG
jgi:hypothetical protein